MKEKYAEDADHHRWFYDTDLDSDVDEDGNTTLPRRIRTVSRSEVYGIMATHCEWYLAQQLATSDIRHMYVNLKLWYAFCREVKAAKPLKEAHDKKRNPGRKWAWGTPYQPGKKSEERKKSKKKKKADYIFPRDVEDNDEEQVDDEEADAPGRPEYDDDLSGFSSAPDSDSDESDSNFDMNPENFRHVPRWMLTPPVRYPGQLSWSCPDRQCGYSVDLRNMPKSPVLSDAEYQFLQGHLFSAEQEEVQKLLFRIISEHYFEHGRRLGFVFADKAWEEWDSTVGDEDDVQDEMEVEVVIKNEPNF
ncbi:hypothetical protein BT96DRAFT_1012447 [Gymnopus androsaceus JB14]|uniref:Uncharacterized protein n=1 Tax=Gymnopus androsaceus JB14 TaxID=1447944 RepID=A0A6A4IFL4_9AGAR|nr:hypothetical protein BT96DRAFT_1012447 [Gymnopus androsaceus JB14]